MMNGTEGGAGGEDLPSATKEYTFRCGGCRGFTPCPHLVRSWCSPARSLVPRPSLVVSSYSLVVSRSLVLRSSLLVYSFLVLLFSFFVTRFSFFVCLFACFARSSSSVSEANVRERSLTKTKEQHKRVYRLLFRIKRAPLVSRFSCSLASR